MKRRGHPPFGERVRRLVFKAESSFDRAAKWTLLALVEHTKYKDRGTAWPSEATLARMTGLSERAVRRATAWLAARGMLDITVYRGHRSNAYWIHETAVKQWVETEGKVRKPRKKRVAKIATQSGQNNEESGHHGQRTVVELEEKNGGSSIPTEIPQRSYAPSRHSVVAGETPADVSNVILLRRKP